MLMTFCPLWQRDIYSDPLSPTTLFQSRRVDPRLIVFSLETAAFRRVSSKVIKSSPQDASRFIILLDPFVQCGDKFKVVMLAV